MYLYDCIDTFGGHCRARGNHGELVSFSSIEAEPFEPTAADISASFNPDAPPFLFSTAPNSENDLEPSMPTDLDLGAKSATASNNENSLQPSMPMDKPGEDLVWSHERLFRSA